MNNHKTSKWIKIIKNKPFLLVLAFYIYSFVAIQGRKNLGWFIAFVVGTLIISLIAQRIIQFIDKHEKKIEEELKRWIIYENTPPNGKLFEKNIIPEYEISKLLSPIEAWFLYDMQIWKEDIVCLVYKWAQIWIISLAYKKWWITITKIKDIQKNAPSYERSFRNILFKEQNAIHFPNEKIYKNLNLIKKLVEQECINKWWICCGKAHSIIDNIKLPEFLENNELTWKRYCIFLWIWLLTICLQKLTNNKLVLGIGIVIMVLYIFATVVSMLKSLTTKNKPTTWSSKKNIKTNEFIPLWRLLYVLLWFILIVIWCIMCLTFSHHYSALIFIIGITLVLVWIFISVFSILDMMKNSYKSTILLTEKWQELVVKIYWYKKFLKICEEKQLKKLMEEDPLYVDKVLPYAVALGLENTISNKIPQKILNDKTKNIFLLEKII